MGSGIVAVSRCWRKHAWSDLTLLIWICILWRLGTVLVICLMLQKPIKRYIESPWKHEGRWRNSHHKTNFCAKLLHTKLETHFTYKEIMQCSQVHEVHELSLKLWHTNRIVRWWLRCWVWKLSIIRGQIWVRLWLQLLYRWWCFQYFLSYRGQKSHNWVRYVHIFRSLYTTHYFPAQETDTQDLRAWVFMKQIVNKGGPHSPRSTDLKP